MKHTMAVRPVLTGHGDELSPYGHLFRSIRIASDTAFQAQPLSRRKVSDELGNVLSELGRMDASLGYDRGSGKRYPKHSAGNSIDVSELIFREFHKPRSPSCRKSLKS